MATRARRRQEARTSLRCCTSRLLATDEAIGGRMIRRFPAGVGILAACIVWITSPAPAAAQAKGSADADAARRSDPHWKAPRNAWGQPDLEGIWTTDDMRGVP